MKKKALSIISYISNGAIFLALALILVLYASGYKLDLNNRNIYQTGMIIVRTDNSTNSIILNDEEKGSGTVLIRDLEPNQYQVKVSREGYKDFVENINLEAGEAKLFDSIVLFKAEPEIEEFNDLDEIYFEKLAHTDGIIINNNELYARGKFLTRFEKEISDASWYPNEKYIGLTTNGRFKILNIDTEEIYDMFEKDSDEPVIFVNAGKTVIYKNNEQIYRATIR